MVTLGKKHTLRVMRSMRPGLFLDGKNLGDLLLPHSEVPPGTAVGAELEVFVLRDSDDRLIATTRQPAAMVGEFGVMQVVSADPHAGAFLDWGLAKDLFLPKREQTHPARPGDWVVAYVMIDERSQRIVATERVSRHFSTATPPYRAGEKVALIVYEQTDLGYLAIVDGAHRGLLYHTDLGVRLYYGQKLDGYVRQVRPDGKIDLAADPAGYARVAPLADRILAELHARGGRLPYDDSSSPEDIRTAFAASKKAFKQAIGALFKERRIVLLEHGISLPIDPPDPVPAPLPPRVPTRTAGASRAPHAAPTGRPGRHARPLHAEDVPTAPAHATKYFQPVRRSKTPPAR